MSKHRNPRAKVPSRPPPAKRYATHEEQARALLEAARRRDRRAAKALVEVLTSATPSMLAAFGVLVDFVARAARVK
jgi:hypothetical protein